MKSVGVQVRIWEIHPLIHQSHSPAVCCQIHQFIIKAVPIFSHE